MTATTFIGHYVTIGHGAVVQASVVEDYALIGNNAVVCEGCYVEKKGMLAAGGVLLPGSRIPAGQLWGGNPAKFLRDLSDTEKENIYNNAQNYADLAWNQRTALRGEKAADAPRPEVHVDVNAAAPAAAHH